MKRRRKLLVGTLVLVAGFLTFAWYYGFVPVLGGTERAGVRHALNLHILPFGTTINITGVESWTDYIFEADLSINPKQFDRLLAGRPFKKHDHVSSPELTSAHRIENYKGFLASESWSWSYRPKDLKEGDFGAGCTLHTNTNHDRVFILFTAD